MTPYKTLPRNRYFEVISKLMRENRSDDKVCLMAEVDMSSALRLRESLNRATESKPSYTALVVKAITLALKQHPYANRVPVGFPFWRRMVQFEQMDIAVAVERDTPGMEMVAYPATVRDAGHKELMVISNELRTLASAPPENCPVYRQFKWIVENLPPFLADRILRLPALLPSLWARFRGGSVLVSSPAKWGADAVVGTWPWPVGFSFGLVKERPVVIAGRVVARPTMLLTLSFDRTLMAGSPAARFLNTIAESLIHAEERLGPKVEAPQTKRVAPALPQVVGV